MSSTYVNALRLNEMGTGDESGNWGTVTNLNLDMIGEAFGYGAEAIADASTHTITMADGAVDEARNIYLKCTGGGQACTVTLAPNTESKIWIIENATSYTLTFSQGSGANVVIPASDVKVIATDGAGGGAVVYDLFVDLNIATKLTIKNPATSSSPATVLLQSGDTDVAAADVLGKIQFQAPDEGAGTDAILVAAEVAAISEGDFSSSSNATKLSFKTGASEAATEKMSLSSGGNLTLPTDTTVVNFGVDSDVTLTHVADTGLQLSTTGANDTTLTIHSTATDAGTAPKLTLHRDSASPADNDIAGNINYAAENSAGEATTYAQIYSTLLDVTDATEDGSLTFTTITNGSQTLPLTLKGSGIIVPDGGNVGSTTTPTPIDILAAGEVGLGPTTAITGANLYIYNNDTTHNAINCHLDNASTAKQGIIITVDGPGIALYGQCNGANYAGYFNSTGTYGIYATTGNAGVGPAAFYSQNGAAYLLVGLSNAHGIYASSGIIVGALTKGSGTFRIPHGLREGHDLAHSFIEGPQCDLIYRGRVTLVDGQASIDMDSHYGMTQGTFEWLTKADDVQTFTSNETGWDAVRSSFSGDTITIECQNPASTDTISWMVIAERGDPNIRESTITDDEGNLIIEPESIPEPPRPPEPPPPDA